MSKIFYSWLLVAILVVTGCAAVESSAPLYELERATLASEQTVTAKTTQMNPKLKAVTSDGFKILFMDGTFNQDNGIPVNVRDLAATQCQSLGKVAMYLGASQDLLRLYMITAHYKCMVKPPEG